MKDYNGPSSMHNPRPQAAEEGRGAVTSIVLHALPPEVDLLIVSKYLLLVLQYLMSVLCGVYMVRTCTCMYAFFCGM